MPPPTTIIMNIPEPRAVYFPSPSTERLKMHDHITDVHSPQATRSSAATGRWYIATLEPVNTGISTWQLFPRIIAPSINAIASTDVAVAMAVLAYKNKEVEKIILTRPAVEAGEKLGFLPGDLQNKVDPYLRPLYDALYDFLGAETFKNLSERGVIEVAPLAYMRGRTLNDAFIILDEAQNCTIEQMKMFLTRFGEGSRVVVTGDITQIDLPPERKSGLVHALGVLKDVEGISQIYLTYKDVVRHEMVQRIISAYDRAYKKD